MKKSMYLPNRQGFPQQQPRESYYLQGKNRLSSPGSPSSRPKQGKPGPTTMAILGREFGHNRIAQAFGEPDQVGRENHSNVNQGSDEPPRPWGPSSCNLLCHCRQCVPAHARHRCEKTQDPTFLRCCKCRCPMCPTHGQNAIVRDPKGQQGPVAKAVQQGWNVPSAHQHQSKNKQPKGQPQFFKDKESSSSSGED